MLEFDILPQGWTIARFEDLLDYIQPTNYIVKSTEYKDTYKTPVLTAGKSFIKGYTNETDGIFTQLPTIIFDDFTTATQFVNFPFKVKSSAMKILQPTCGLVNIKLAFYYMQTIHLKGETHKRFWISEYSQIPVPLAPLPEQTRILAKLEQLLTELDKGIAQLKTAQQQLKVYRQAVLKWAFEGMLTNEKFDKVPLSIVIEQPKYGTSKKCDYKIKGTGVLRIPNISNGCIDDSDLKFAKFDKEELETYSLTDGDILTIRSNGSVDLVGKCALISKKETNYLFAGYLIRLRPLKEKIIPKFLLLVLSSHELRTQIESKAKSSSGVNNINSGEIKSLKISLPTLKQQEKILQQIESRLSICDKIEETIESSLQQAEVLRLSIIKKAFEGKLVPQDPNDEPAEKLLERIKATKKMGASIQKNRRLNKKIAI